MPPKSKPLTHKHDYDSLQPPGFQWYAHDPYLSNRMDKILDGPLNGPADTPEEKTWKTYFAREYKDLKGILCPDQR